MASSQRFDSYLFIAGLGSKLRLDGRFGRRQSTNCCLSETQNSQAQGFTHIHKVITAHSQSGPAVVSPIRLQVTNLKSDGRREIDKKWLFHLLSVVFVSWKWGSVRV